jgi:tetratricopeptide (TPR) repeat protein
VGGALKVRLVGGGAQPRHVAQPAAYDDYLLGKGLLRLSTPDGNRRSGEAFGRAVAVDPQFAAAWAGLARATLVLADAEPYPANMSGYDRALASAEKAIVLDPASSEAYATRGALRTSARWDWEGARADLERALALNAGDPENHLLYAYAVLGPLGHIADAVSEARKATALDPLYAAAWSVQGRMQLMAGDVEGARAALERSVQIVPDQTLAPRNLALAMVLGGHAQDALAVAEKSSVALFRDQGRAVVLHALGQNEQARAALEKMAALYSQYGAFQIAEAHAWFSEPDRAFEWLDRALLQRDSGLHALKYDVMMRSLYPDPRWAALLRRMNLPTD